MSSEFPSPEILCQLPRWIREFWKIEKRMEVNDEPNKTKPKTSNPIR